MCDAKSRCHNSRPAAFRPKPRYQWLLFDADGTLFDYDQAETTALRQACQQLGLTFDATCLATCAELLPLLSP